MGAMNKRCAVLFVTFMGKILLSKVGNKVIDYNMLVRSGIHKQFIDSLSRERYDFRSRATDLVSSEYT